MKAAPLPSGLRALLLACFCLAATVAATSATVPVADPVVMTIDGEPVSVAEYTLVMEGQVSPVFGHFKATQNLDDHLGYWKDDDGSAENPIRRLRQATTEELKRVKTIQALAKREGVVADISFAAFQAKLAAENTRRAKAVANKEVIYGPKQYQPYRYYYFELADLDQAALEAFQKKPANAIPAVEIESFYEAHKEQLAGRELSDMREQIARSLQKKNHEKLVAALTAAAKVEIDETVLAGIAPRHDP